MICGALAPRGIVSADYKEPTSITLDCGFIHT